MGAWSMVVTLWQQYEDYYYYWYAIFLSTTGYELKWLLLYHGISILDGFDGLLVNIFKGTLETPVGVSYRYLETFGKSLLTLFIRFALILPISLMH